LREGLSECGDLTSLFSQLFASFVGRNIAVETLSAQSVVKIPVHPGLKARSKNFEKKSKKSLPAPEAFIKRVN
jgi:hypothetical protein